MSANLGITLRPDQWHLHNEGQTGGTPGVDINVLPVWADYRGQGIRVVVFDSGVDTTHPDLTGNYLTEFGFDFLNNTNNGSYLALKEYDAHGTLVAGFIAATGAQFGLRGVAYEAMFTSYGDFNGKDATTAFARAADSGFDVMNNSWGHSIPFIGTYQGNEKTLAGLEYAVENGRDGLGLNIVFAAGNEYKLPRFVQELGFEWSGLFPYADANGDTGSASRFTITVAALDHDGTYGDDSGSFGYTTPGAPVLVSAPGSAVVSTDIQGDLGYNPGENFAVQYGTSFAAPIVSGVIALMLDANPLLGYRDVKEILAYSARLTDLDDPSWQVNSAIDFNGGGLWTNDNYGFGMVDATAAVRLAETWQKQSTFANEAVVTTDAMVQETAIPDGGAVTFTFTLDHGVSVENIELEFDMTHDEFGDLIVTLISPSGTESVLLYRTGDARVTEITKAVLAPEGAEDFDLSQLVHTLSSNDFWGEESGGVWTVRVADAKQGNTGVVEGLELRAFGASIQADKTYIYTDDFALLAGLEPERTVLDNASGIHTLNLAALSDAVIIDLGDGSGVVAGKQLSIADGTTIGTVFSGDGNDLVMLSQAGGEVFAGRGNDTVHVFGTAAIDGGAGFDRIILSDARDAYSVTLNDGAVTLTQGSGGTGQITTQGVQYFSFDADGDTDEVLIVLDAAEDALVARFYDLLLGRSADFDGLAYWVGALEGGLDLGSIAIAFAGSSEFVMQGAELSQIVFLELLYEQILGRAADEAGLDYWAGQIEAGRAIGEIAAGFALSAEANAITLDHIMLMPTPEIAIA